MVDVGARTVTNPSSFLHVSLKILQQETHFVKEPSRPIDLNINGSKRVVAKKQNYNVEIGNGSLSKVNTKYIAGPKRMAVFGKGLTHELLGS